jgi:mRNA interferase HigB
MAMRVLNYIELERFGDKHRDATLPLKRWLQLSRQATWKSLRDVRATFPNADGVRVGVSGGDVVVATVFNIKGNEYRLITIINYVAASIRVVDVLTHTEYSSERWKGRL